MASETFNTAIPENRPWTTPQGDGIGTLVRVERQD